MSKVNWRPKTEAEEAEMMKHLDPEEREILDAYNAGSYDSQIVGLPANGSPPSRFISLTESARL